MEVKAILSGVPEVVAKLKSIAPEVQGKIRVLVSETVLALRDGMKSNIYSMFNIQTGKFPNAVQARMEESGGGDITGVVWIDGKAIPWARIQEEGGIINHPGSDKFQAFLAGNGGGFSGGIRQGVMVFTHRTKPHQIPIPSRPYASFALAKVLGPFNSGMRGIVDDVLRS